MGMNNMTMGNTTIGGLIINYTLAENITVRNDSIIEVNFNVIPTVIPLNP